jgi:hypothetical protein
VPNEGVAESSEQIYNILALDKCNALKKPTKLKWKASSLEDIFDALAAQDWYPLEINGVEVIAGKRLKQGVAESTGKRCKQCGMIDCPCPGVTCKCKPIAGWEPGKGFKKAMDESALNEKLNLKTMDTGAVIKDFEKSNAPQFRGKTKEKRKQMAVAAKMGAMKKKKKIGESVDSEWTTDSLASHLFEQELTYEDRLNNLLLKKLSK